MRCDLNYVKFCEGGCLFDFVISCLIVGVMISHRHYIVTVLLNLLDYYFQSSDGSVFNCTIGGVQEWWKVYWIQTVRYFSDLLSVWIFRTFRITVLFQYFSLVDSYLWVARRQLFGIASIWSLLLKCHLITYGATFKLSWGPLYDCWSFTGIAINSIMQKYHNVPRSLGCPQHLEDIPLNTPNWHEQFKIHHTTVSV